MEYPSWIHNVDREKALSAFSELITCLKLAIDDTRQYSCMGSWIDKSDIPHVEKHQAFLDFELEGRVAAARTALFQSGYNLPNSWLNLQLSASTCICRTDDSERNFVYGTGEPETFQPNKRFTEFDDTAVCQWEAILSEIQAEEIRLRLIPEKQQTDYKEGQTGNQQDSDDVRANIPRFIYATNHDNPNFRDLAAEINNSDANPEDTRSFNQITREYFTSLSEDEAMNILAAIRQFESRKRNPGA